MRPCTLSLRVLLQGRNAYVHVTRIEKAVYITFIISTPLSIISVPFGGHDRNQDSSPDLTQLYRVTEDLGDYLPLTHLQNVLPSGELFL